MIRGSIMKLLIADDEIQIRTGLEQGIDWEELGIEQVYTASNGIEALELCNKYQPEIILTDIRMPGLDGLELSRQLIKQYEMIKIIILSGYSEFEYARQAIKIGVLDYLLKPIKIPELVQKVEQAIQEIQTYQLENEHKKDYSRQNQKQDIEAFIEGRIGQQELAKTQLVEYTELSFNKMIIYGLGEVDDPYKEDAEQATIYAINYLQKELKEIEGAIVYTKDNRVGWIIEVASGKVRYEKEALLKQIVVSLNQLMKNQYGNTLSVAISQEELWTEIPSLHARCKLGISHRMYIGEKSFIVCEQLEEHQTRHYVRTNEQILIEYIKIYEYEKCIAYIRNEFEILKKMKVTSTALVKGVCIEFKNILIKIIVENDINIEQLLNNNIKLLSDIPEYTTIDAYCKWVENLYFLVLTGVTRLGGEKHNRVIREALYFIGQNYHQNITVEQVASHVDKSKNYFSYLFKKETGIVFIEYLNKIRIEKAKELLQTTSNKTYEIAEQVGYNDYKYFSIVFKKLEGVSPAQFRKKKTVL